MLKTAIIGVTGWGREHLRLLLRGHAAGDLQATAAVVINSADAEQQIAQLKALDCRIYGSVEEMWAEQSGSIDLCMIPTSISTHHRFTLQALENGAHVFLEKPACATLGEVDNLTTVAESKGLRVCLGFQDAYDPQLRQIKQRILDEELGALKSIRGWGNWPRSTSYYARNRWAGKLKDQNGWVLDSPVNNAMAHFLNLMLYWAGSSPEGFGRPVSIEGDLYRVQDIESFDTASMRLEMDSGCSILYAVSHSGSSEQMPTIRIQCENGFIDWTYCGSIHFSGNGQDVSEPYMDPMLVRDSMMDSVVRWITTGEGSVMTIRDASWHTMCVNSLHDCSAIAQIDEKGRKVRKDNSQEWHYLEGIEGFLKEASESGKLLRELDIPWPAPPGTKLWLSDYRDFRGGFELEEAEARP